MWFFKYYWTIVAMVLIPVGIYVAVTGSNRWAWGLIVLTGLACSVHSLLTQLLWNKGNKRSVR